MTDLTNLKIAAVIPAFNGELVLRKCLDSLIRQSRPLDAIYVIDNASSDGTPTLISNGYAGKVIYVRLNQNLGPAGGFAFGMSKAVNDHCDWVWLMDQDGSARLDSLEKLLVCALSDGSIVAVAPAKFDPEGTLWPAENINGGVAPALSSYSGMPFDIEATMWSGLLVKTLAICQLGLPLSQLFGWWCDGEYCFRLRKLGRVVLVPSSAICHHRTGAVHLEYLGYWKHYYYQRNSMYLYLNGYLPSPGLWRIVSGLIRQAAYITLRQDHKISRLRILSTAAIHAFTGRMGRGPDWLH